MAHKHDTASQKEFSKFTRYITDVFLEKFGKSYMTQENTHNRWRSECDYQTAAVEFLILKSRVYLRNLDQNDSKSKDPHFLKALVTLMADYLSAYTMRSGISRRQAKDLLMYELYTNNAYIQCMLAAQSQKRCERRQRTPATVAERRKREAAEKAKQARDLHCQVMADFAEVNQLRKKR